MSKPNSHPGNSPNEKAVEQWNNVRQKAKQQGKPTKDERFLLRADVHNPDHRRKIEEIVNHGEFKNAERACAFMNAFSELKRSVKEDE